MGMTQGREGKRERGKEGGRRRKEKEEKEKMRRKKGKTLSTKCFRVYGVTSTSRKEGINVDLNEFVWAERSGNITGNGTFVILNGILI